MAQSGCRAVATQLLLASAGTTCRRHSLPHPARRRRAGHDGPGRPRRPRHPTGPPWRAVSQPRRPLRRLPGRQELRLRAARRGRIPPQARISRRRPFQRWTDREYKPFRGSMTGSIQIFQRERVMSHSTAWRPLGMLVGAVVCSGCASSSQRDAKIVNLGAKSGNVGWAMYNMSYDGVRSSPLSEINVGNVQNLRPLCRVKLGEGGTLHASPVVVGDTLFITTAHSTAALDATTCKLIWRFVDPPAKADVWAVNRGVAYLGGRVFRGTPDGRLVALRSDSGRVLWNVKVGDPAVGEFLSSAPIAWRGTVFIGLAGGGSGTRGRVTAFDAPSGAEKWRFWTVPMGREPGAETWHIPETAARGGGGMWSSYPVDTAGQELFVPVGNPAPDWAPATRPGDNLFTDAVVVLDAASGALKWWYQLTPNDGFDYDLGAAPVLYTTGTGVPQVLLASKDGNIYALDRRTHALAFKTPITTISNPGSMPTPAGVRACPGPLGGVEWNGPALDARSRTIYVGAVDWCAIYESGPAKYVRGGLYWATNVKPISADTAHGWLTAVDADGGAVRWRFRTPAPLVAGVTHTAGGLVLTGDLAGNFYAFDDATGKLAFQTDLGGAIAGGVITYAAGGRQFVAATAGNIGRTTFGALGSPTLVVLGLGRPAQAGAADGAAVAEITLPDIATGTAQKMSGRGAAEATAAGEKVYQVCAACHGARGEGGLGANLQTSKRDLAGVIAYIKAPTGSMPKLYPGALSDADVAAVAAYVMTLRKR